MSRAASIAALLSSVCAGCGLVLDFQADSSDGGRSDGAAIVDAGGGDRGASDGGDGDAASADGGGASDGGSALPGPVTIAMTVSKVASPAVEWNGSHFLVGVLVAEGDPAAGMTVPFLQRYLPGLVTSEDDIALRTLAAARTSVSIAFHDTYTVVAWHDTEPNVAEGEVLEEGGSRWAMARIADVDDSRDQHNVVLFQHAGDFHAVIRRRDLDMMEYRLWHAPLGPDATAFPAPEELSSGDAIEIDRVEAGDVTAVAASGVGRLYLFDGTSWAVGPDVATTIMTNECGVAVRTGGLWTLCSDEVEPRQLWLAAIELGAPTSDVSDTGWLGPDPVIAAHDTGATAAWVHETEVGDRSLGLGVIAADGTASPACVVPRDRAFVNEPDIACGGGYCAVVWLEGDASAGHDFIVRFAQFPGDDPSHLCP